MNAFRKSTRLTHSDFTIAKVKYNQQRKEFAIFDLEDKKVTYELFYIKN